MEIKMTTETLITRIAHMIAYGVPLDSIRETILLEVDGDEGMFFLLYQAAIVFMA